MQSTDSSSEEPPSPQTTPQNDGAVKDKVVGPTPEELESFNELIQFDHVYFKPSAPVQASSPSIKKNISILKPSVKAHCQKEVPASTQPETTLSLDIPEEDLANLSQTLDELIDFDSLVADDCKPQVLNSVDNRKRKASSAIETPVVKKHCAISDSSHEFFSANEQHFGLESSLSPIHALNVAESGYSSDSSGPIASPKSDTSSSDLGLENSWEESFSELFPSLI